MIHDQLSIEKMASISHLRSIHPKISSMPRKHSKALTHLEIYKMSVEKQRLEQELQNLKNREKQISQRLTEIEKHTEALLSGAHSPASTGQSSAPKKESSPSLNSGFEFEEVYVEY